jgi:hypothetical protein
MTDVVDLEEESDPTQNEATEATRESPEVQFVRAAVRSPAQMTRGFQLDYRRVRPQTVSTGTNSQPTETFRQGVAMRAQFSHRPPWGGLPGIHAFWIAEDQGELDIPPVIDLQGNYQIAGLMMENAAPSGPSYKPPTPPPLGYTRTVQEDEEVICPNCDRELGTGDDERQQIWVSKHCGHVCFPRILLRFYKCLI